MTTAKPPSVRLYTRRWCGYCAAACRLLKHRNIGYEEIPVDGDSETRRKVSQENGNWPTVPMIFIGEHFVGGYRELSRLNTSGQLDTLLEGAA